MKKKIVLWGNDGEDKKILIGIELKAEENKVDIYTFSEDIATEEFYNQLMDQWRSNKETAFPEGHKVIERPLSMTDDLLPEDIKVQRTDLITRAKTEWHFAVLSAKLYDMYHTEVEDLKEKVDRLTDFDNGIWNELIAYWDKLGNQIKERNLFREQADTLRDKSNVLFEQLKALRSKANEEFAKVSAEKLEEYKVKLNAINEKVEKGLGLKPIFEELKDIQHKFKDEKFTKRDRNKLWKNIDILFKKVKEKKYGKPQDTGGNQVSRLDRRYQGLMGAIEKMERSINRDQQDIDFQNKRAGETDGQLEAQIRQAKVQMIQGRIASKQEKLNEMLATKVDLEKRAEKEKQRAIKNKEKEEIKKKKEEVKEKIAAEMEQKSQNIDAQKLEAAASAIKESKKPKTAKKESMLGTIATMASEAIEDVVDTAKAVGEVVSDKIEEKYDDVKEAISDIKDDVTEKAADIKEDVQDQIKENEKGEGDTLKKGGMMAAAAAAGGLLVKKAMDTADSLKEKAEDVIEEVKESVSEAKEAVAEKTSEAKEAVVEDTTEVVEDVKVDATEAVATAKEVAIEVKEEVKEEVETTKETVSDTKEVVAESAEDITNEVKSETSETTEAIKELAADVKEDVASEVNVEGGDAIKKGGLMAAATAAGGLLANKGMQAVDELKEKAESAVEGAKDLASDAKAQVTDTVDATKNVAVDMKEKVTTDIADNTSTETVEEVAARLGSSEEE